MGRGRSSKFQRCGTITGERDNCCSGQHDRGREPFLDWSSARGISGIDLRLYRDIVNRSTAVFFYVSSSQTPLRDLADSSEFLRTIAPRIAYANPSLPFIVERTKDPRSKSKDPNGPNAGAKQWEEGQPGPSVVVDFRECRQAAISSRLYTQTSSSIYTSRHGTLGTCPEHS